MTCHGAPIRPVRADCEITHTGNPQGNNDVFPKVCKTARNVRISGAPPRRIFAPLTLVRGDEADHGNSNRYWRSFGAHEPAAGGYTAASAWGVGTSVGRIR